MDHDRSESAFVSTRILADMEDAFKLICDGGATSTLTVTKSLENSGCTLVKQKVVEIQTAHWHHDGGTQMNTSTHCCLKMYYHLESCTPGTRQYKMVCTGTSQYVP
jgi:hypothetical protein